MVSDIQRVMKPIAPYPSPLRAGFTLVELLVAVTIVAILAGLAFKGSHRMILQGDKIKSVANMRQCSAAIMAYAGEHNNCLPNQWEGDSLGRGFIKGALMKPYLPTPIDGAPKTFAPTWVCPMLRRILLATGSYRENDPNLGRFVFNWMLWQRAGREAAGSVAAINSGTPLAPVRLSTVVKPSDALLLANLTGGMRGGYGTGLAHIAFIDGSIRTYRDNSYKAGAPTPPDVSPSVCRDYYNAKSPDGTPGYRGYDW